MSGGVGEYLNQMRGALSDPALLGVNPLWLDQERPTREAILARTAAEGGRELISNEAWLAGMLGGMQVAIAILTDPTKAAGSMDRGCPCGQPHVVVERTTMVGHILLTAQALLAQHDFLTEMDAIPEVPGAEEG